MQTTVSMVAILGTVALCRCAVLATRPASHRKPSSTATTTSTSTTGPRGGETPSSLEATIAGLLEANLALCALILGDRFGLFERTGSLDGQMDGVGNSVRDNEVERWLGRDLAREWLAAAAPLDARLRYSGGTDMNAPDVATLLGLARLTGALTSKALRDEPLSLRESRKPAPEVEEESLSVEDVESRRALARIVAAAFGDNAELLASKLSTRLPRAALDMLEDGVDVGCLWSGNGELAVALARAFPRSRFFGYEDSHELLSASRELASRRAVSNARFFDVRERPLSFGPPMGSSLARNHSSSSESSPVSIRSATGATRPAQGSARASSSSGHQSRAPFERRKFSMVFAAALATEHDVFSSMYEVRDALDPHDGGFFVLIAPPATGSRRTGVPGRSFVCELARVRDMLSSFTADGDRRTEMDAGLARRLATEGFVSARVLDPPLSRFFTAVACER